MEDRKIYIYIKNNGPNSRRKYGRGEEIVFLKPCPPTRKENLKWRP